MDLETYKRIRGAVELRHPARTRANRKAAAPVVQELREAGFDVETVGELPLKYHHYREAVPILVRWLPLVADPSVKEAIARGLTVRFARPTATPALIEAFDGYDELERRDFYAKWAIGNALSVVADDSVFDDIVRLARDRRHGRARQMLAFALGNMKNPQAVDVLLELINDADVATFTLRPLGKLRAERARGNIEGFLRHSDPWVRKEAKRALEKIDKASR